MTTTDDVPTIGLARLLSPLQRLRLHATAAIAVIFLLIYGQLVCPLLDSLSAPQLLASLSAILVFQILLREWLLRQPLRPGLSPGRFGFFLSVISWLAAGVAAWGLHNILYPDFAWHSHVKLLVGYWVLGAGMLAQLDYAILERLLRFPHHSTSSGGDERLAWRLLESFTVFAMAPAVAMGLLALRVSQGDYQGFDFAGEIIFLSLCFMGTAILVAYYWGQTLREDTDRMLVGLDAIGAGRFDVRLNIARGDELGRVASTINHMAEELSVRERIREAFGFFVSPEIAERFIQDHIRNGQGVRLGGERCEVTVLMCDLRDFTPLSESLSPEALTACLNSYFGEMVEIIRSHGGIVDKFIGDAIMAVFGLVPGEESPTISAVRAAGAMLRGMDQVNLRHPPEADFPPLRIGIGIHCGEVVAGYIGSPDRLSFTVVGRTVNIAARLEAQAKAPYPPILYSAAVAERIAPWMTSQAVDTLKLKGVGQPIAVYSPASVPCSDQRSSLS